MQTLVMGVVNVTPDSFYDGGRHFEPADAIAHGEALAAEGADILDVGGESTRPGADPVDVDEELRRTVPVVEALASVGRVSVDTMKPAVARAAVGAGASLINDVSCSLAPLAAELGVGIVLMHMRGTPRDMRSHATYDDVVEEVTCALVDAAARARAAGVDEVFIDPGIGFAKTTAHNLALLRALPRLVATGIPVLVGTSRKRFLGEIARAPGEPLLGPEERFEASLATAVWAMACGVAAVRVHDVEQTAHAARIVGESVQGVSR